mmetsp:Transcript_41155/g.66884  ORF Transcript_41155/g.66884 Transcript_41155/m.66884 type:complete len:96 (+) Transcript_41155:950-1237(+)
MRRLFSKSSLMLLRVLLFIGKHTHSKLQLLVPAPVAYHVLRSIAYVRGESLTLVKPLGEPLGLHILPILNITVAFHRLLVGAAEEGEHVEGEGYI